MRSIGEREAVQITEARAVLEGLAARHAAIAATDHDLSAIQAIHAEMGPQVERGDLWAYLDANRRLHACIVKACGHATAQRLLDVLNAQLVRFQYRTIFLAPGRAQQSLDEHTDLVEALVQRDPDRAEAAMTRHLGNVAMTLHVVGARDPIVTGGAG
ncbi:MAG: FCD domain-containing protein [Actinomycetota bacterium]|nr:FCD domain-containing protein [Actinomycetota bacterium]